MSLRGLSLVLCGLFLSGSFIAPGLAWLRSGSAEEILSPSRRGPASLLNDPRCSPLLQTLERHRALNFDDFDWTSAASNSLLKSLTENPIICSSESSFTEDLRPLADRICPLVRELAPRSADIHELRARVLQSFMKLDGAYLVSRHPQWRLAQPCSEESQSSGLDGVFASLRQQRCPLYWSPARCARVLRLLESQSPESWGS